MSSAFYLSYVGLWVLVTLETILLLGLIRTVYRKSGHLASMTKSGQGLPPGTPVPEFSTTDLAGETIDSRALVGRPTALLFVAPNCDSCVVTLHELDALRQKTGGRVIVFCLAEHSSCADLVEQYGLHVPVVSDGEQRIAGLLHVTSAPTAVLVDRVGNVETYGHPRAPVDLERLLTVPPGEEGFSPGPDEDRATVVTA